MIFKNIRNYFNSIFGSGRKESVKHENQTIRSKSREQLVLEKLIRQTIINKHNWSNISDDTTRKYQTDIVGFSCIVSIRENHFNFSVKKNDLNIDYYDLIIKNLNYDDSFGVESNSAISLIIEIERKILSKKNWKMPNGLITDYVSPLDLTGSLGKMRMPTWVSEWLNNY